MIRTRTTTMPLSVLVFLSLAISLPAAAVTLQADLILRGGQIYTPSGWAEAIAIQDGVIIAVGDYAEVAEFGSNETSEMDLQGATVLPGFHDNHVHPMGAGLAQLQCRFPQGSTREQILSAVAACVENRTDGEWITGGQWEATSFGAEPMDRSALDQVAPNNPVSLVDISAHALWVNSTALELAGITATTPNPAGGIIERDADGRATGVLRELARSMIRDLIPPPTEDQALQALQWSLDEMLSQGITSFTAALVDEMELQAYATLADLGLLHQRVTACMVPTNRGVDAGPLPDFIEYRNLYARDRVSPTCIKLMLDGVPTDGHTAAMVEPYADAVSENDTGILMMPAERLNSFVTELDALGFTVKMHTVGDAAVRAGLDAIEAARNANGFTSQLHEVGHNSFVQPDDIGRAKDIAATFEMSPYIWFPNPIIPDIAKAIGPERMQRWIPLKDAIDAGALVVPGSDWSVVPSVNPWIAVETLVTRQAPGGVGDALGASQKITLEQAIDLFTVNSARQKGKSAELGTIERGMTADLIVIDQNPFEVPVTDLHKTRVLVTMIEGEIVYSAETR